MRLELFYRDLSKNRKNISNVGVENYMDNMSLGVLICVSLPEFIYVLCMSTLVIDGKRNLKFDSIIKIFKFIGILFTMLVITYMTRRLSPTVFVSFIIQSIIYITIFKVIVFREYSFKDIISGYSKVIILQLTVELVFEFLYGIAGYDTNYIIQSDQRRIIYSLPLHFFEMMIFVICYRWLNLKFINDYKSVRNISIVIEILLILCQVFLSSILVDFNKFEYFTRIGILCVVLILGAINFLYIYVLNLLSKGMYNRLYSKIIQAREEQFYE